MAEREIFSRVYESYDSAGQLVWLPNGASASASADLSVIQVFPAGETLVQGALVYVSGTKIWNTTAASGQPLFESLAIGVTTQSGVAGANVPVNLDGIVTISDQNITADSQLTPGEYYYASMYRGQITRYSTASGQILASGSNPYQVAAPVGVALSNSQLSIEIARPTVLRNG